MEVTAVFTAREIVSTIVNLGDAQRNLTQEQFSGVLAVFYAYRSDKAKRRLSLGEYLVLRDEMIAHFDLIGPYYQFCGDPKREFMRFKDHKKFQYRESARALLRANELFGDEWMLLHKEFLEKFPFSLAAFEK